VLGAKAALRQPTLERFGVRLHRRHGQLDAPLSDRLAPIPGQAHPRVNQRVASWFCDRAGAEQNNDRERSGERENPGVRASFGRRVQQ
jgi:hypothetical protein